MLKIEKKPAKIAVVVGACAIVSAASHAHHSGLYDEDRVIEISGTITEVHWINPHVRITLEQQRTDDSVEHWRLEGTSVNALERWGIASDLFRIGDQLIATGPASRFGQSSMIVATARLANGQLVVLWPNVASRLGLADTGVAGLFPPPAVAADDGARGIFRVWTPRGRQRLDADDLPLTETARTARAAYNALDDDPALRCIPPGMPVMLDTPYPVEFIDNGSTIEMRYEEWDGRRTVYMEPGNGPPVQDAAPKGVSFGRWEGATLAILTTHIDYPYFDDVGTPQSGGVVVMERYTPSADESRLDWVVTVTDPATFTESIIRRGFMSWEQGERIKPFNCTLIDDSG